MSKVSDFKQIVFLSAAEDGVIAQCTAMGSVIGEFAQASSGKIYFCYRNDKTHRQYYVNASLNAFQKAAAVFNKCSELHAGENLDGNAEWNLVATQLKSDFEAIEPLGDPETSLWSATIHDTNGGLLTLC